MSVLFAVANLTIAEETLSEPQRDEAISKPLIEPSPSATLFFTSRFPRDKQGNSDLSQLSQCHKTPSAGSLSNNNNLFDADFYARVSPYSNAALKDSSDQSISPSSSSTPQRTPWFLSYQSAPEIGPHRTHIQGDVKVSNSKSVITAQQVIIEHEQKQLIATGGVTIESKKAYLGAQNLSQDSDGKTTLEDANFYFFSNNANGKAEKVVIDNDSNAQLEQLTFSTCPIGKDSWQLSTTQMTLDQQQGWGEAWNTVLRIKGVPIFYFPYINFPTDDRRKSGILSPTIGNSDKNGVSFELPIYWNIAPDMDATFSINHLEKRGTQWGSEFRWLTEGGFGQWSLQGLNDDKLLEESMSLESNGSQDSTERWQNGLSYQSALSDRWLLAIDSHRVSDADYFRDFGAGLEASNATLLTSEADLLFIGDVWELDLFANAYQSLIEQDYYQALPGLSVSADHLSSTGIRWQLTSSWQKFRHQNDAFTETTRLNFTPSVSLPFMRSWGFIEPKLSYQASHYDQQSQLSGEMSNLDRQLPIFSLDSGLYFERSIQTEESGMTHYLSPRLFYSYIPTKKQDEIGIFDTSLIPNDFDRLWQADRYSGLDRVGDTNHVSVALFNSWRNESTGEQLLTVNVGRQYYFTQPEIRFDELPLPQVPSSPWLAEVDYRPTANLQIDGFIEWDPTTNQTKQGKTRLKFEPQPNHIVNLTHRYRAFDVTRPSYQVNEESDFSFVWPLNDKWRVIGRWYNDLQRGQTIESLGGLEYESCCWAIRLVAQKYLNAQLAPDEGNSLDNLAQYSKGIQVQFIFKGIGSAGQSGLTDLLESSISGYRDRLVN